MSDRTWLRGIWVGFAVIIGNVAHYVWTAPDALDATDWDWAYRVLLPLAVVSFLRAAVRLPVAGIAAVFVPLTLAAGLRVADFLQDWWITPNDEVVDLRTRLGLASVGWLTAGLFNLLVWRLELMLIDVAQGERVCLNAPHCSQRRPPTVDAVSQRNTVRHRLRSVVHLCESRVRQ